jgi:uncharacterized protein (DUF2252 family)
MAHTSKTETSERRSPESVGAGASESAGNGIPPVAGQMVEAGISEIGAEGVWRAADEGGTSQLGGEELTREELTTRLARGRALRAVVPREIHATWAPSPTRRSPIDVLAEDDGNRQHDLVPLRYGRMSASPFTFYRGAAAIMAADLAGTPTTGIQVQLCGDCHLNNFGVYASPERRLLFDVNDFDETLPGPWEWDLKRLVASFVIGCRSAPQYTATHGRDAAMAVCRSYRTHMHEFAEMGSLDVWYARVDVDELYNQMTDACMKRRTEKELAKARSKDRLAAFAKLTEVVNGHRQFKNAPPVLIRITTTDLAERVNRQLRAYARSLQHGHRILLHEYKPVDIARKVVGVGSVGTRCLVALMEGRDANDPLFIQIKEAGPSVLEGYLPKSKYKNHAQRVVTGQRHMQAASDIFLGWLRADNGIDFYFRQLQDMKGSVDLAVMRPEGVVLYAVVCGWALARAHARSGDRFQIAAYLGKSTKLDAAMADFAEVYADQNERDYETLMQAIRSGTIPTTDG